MRDWWPYVLAMVFLGTYPVLGALLWIAGAAAFSFFREGDRADEAFDEPESRPRTSILIAAYNEELIIGRTLEAAMALDWPDLEVLVVDDGSPTPDALHWMAAHLVRRRGHGQPARGRPAEAALAHPFQPEMATEDVSMTWQLQDSGWQVRYEPRALVAMPVPETLGVWWRQRVRWARGRRAGAAGRVAGPALQRADLALAAVAAAVLSSSTGCCCRPRPSAARCRVR